MKHPKLIATGLLLVSAIAVACTLKPMPPFIIQVGWLDVAIASVKGYDAPLEAAMLSNLDDAAEDLLGDSWQTDEYRGYVTYLSPNLFGFKGRNVVYMEKPCGQDAQQNSARTVRNARGAGGGFTWFAGRVMQAGTCLYGCNVGTVTVGEVDPL